MKKKNTDMTEESTKTPLSLENSELSCILLDLLTPTQRRVIEEYMGFTGHEHEFWRSVDRKFHKEDGGGWYFGRSHYHYRKAKLIWKDYLDRNGYF